MSDTDNISVFTVGRPPSLEVILSDLPPREEVDRYLSKYFNVKYVVLRMYCSSLSILRALIYDSCHTYLQFSEDGNSLQRVIWQKLIKEVRSILEGPSSSSSLLDCAAFRHSICVSSTQRIKRSRSKKARRLFVYQKPIP